jgi:hypothetical protein
MGEGCLTIIALIILIAVVLPISLSVLLGIGLAGAIYGVGVALYNAVRLLLEAHKTIV